MNKLLAFTLAAILPVLAAAQSNYIIEGSIPTNYKAQKAVMSYSPDDKGGKYKKDTLTIIDGKFEFKGNLARPQFADLKLLMPKPTSPVNQKGQPPKDESMKNVAQFYLDGNINISFDTAGIASYKGGGKEQKAWEFYTMEAAVRSKADKGGTPVMEFYKLLISDFVKRFPDNYVSVDLLDVFTQGSINPRIVEPMYNTLSKRMQNTEKVLKWKPQLDDAIVTFSGTRAAPEFTLNDTEGKAVALSSYRGGYVLVDFWASWCVPCRAENPNVLAAYEKYKEKKFQVLGISLDEKKDAWLKAISEDKLPWRQLCDFKVVNSEVAKMYKISSIPANVLLDPKGNIVGKDLRGKDLQDRLAELIK